MLVSSIGYFDVKKNMNTDYSVKNQPQRNVSAERFGQFDKNPVVSVPAQGFMKKFISSFKAFMAGEKVENPAKYTSLIA